MHHADQPRNPHYEDDIVCVTKHSRWILNSIGIWPAVLEGVGKFLPRIAIGLSNLVLFFTVLQCVLHILLEQKDPLLRLRLLGFACYSLVSLMKYWALTVRKPKIKRCIEQMHADWKQVEFQRDRTLMLKYGKIGRDLTIYSTAFMYSGSICYVTIMQYAIGRQSRMDDNNQTIRVLVYPTYSGFFDVQKTPIYEIVYVFQCICTFMLNTVTAGCCALAALFATHACGQIDIVISQLNDLVEGKFAKKNCNPDDRLTEIVQHHIRIIKFSTTVETVLQEVCFFEFVGSTFVICLLEYYCMTDWQQNNKLGLVTYSMLLISLTFNMLLLCYIGDLLIEKSANIGVSCCMIDWYRLPSKTTQGVILIIAMSNSPMKFTAGRIVYISLATFGNVFKTSFAYLNFVRNAVIFVTDARTRYYNRKLDNRAINATRLLSTVVFVLPTNMHPPVRNHTVQPRNPNYEDDFNYVTKYLKWILNSIGVWPAMFKGIGRFLPKIAIVLSNMVFVFFELQCVLQIIFDHSDSSKLRILGLASYTMVGLLKYWAVTMRKSRIKYCIDEMNTDWKLVELERDRTCMLNYGKIGRDLIVYCALFAYCGNVFYITMLQYAMGSQVNDDNRTIRILIYPMYTGQMGVQNSPVYEITFTLQCICSMMMNAVICGCCGLAALSSTHICGQIDIIISQLDDLVEGKFSKKNYNSNARLMEIVQRHTKILKYKHEGKVNRCLSLIKNAITRYCRFSAMFETVLQEVCLFEFVGTTFVICLIEYYCISNWQQNNRLGLLTYSMILVSLTFNMYLWCYIGDLLIEKSTSIGVSCCMIDWYRLPTKTTQGLVLIIAMSNTPMKISAGRIVYISLSTFGNVLKSSFAYFSFVRNTLM
ncbi:uncharacterized protein LOC122532410 isoform X3 [Frieseomelitta varia]|uniref:uncharacterized protein LOC122532410 isoform X3 n=1 Tax=Frieseomelitta varia TaxID=561572 RepID=UPI001CB6A033|nr:uncharacterized protein LOC122532410 isoform X3 [Frieseomelitta varia]